jgi:hypothetical protein
MHVIARAADRMLNALVPKITADASCSPGTHTYFCYCRAGGGGYNLYYTQKCTCSPTGALYCGACTATSICE